MALTKVSYSLINGASANILDFGAVGNGTTDDTAAIQAAIDAVYATGTYGTVIVPPSPSNQPYIFTAVTVKSKITLKGTGGVLKLKNNVCVNPAVSYFLIHNLTHTDVVYDSLIIDGNQANNTQFLVADAITAVGANVVVQNCIITNPPDSGVMFTDAPLGKCLNNRIEGASDLGIYVNSAEVATPLGNMVISGNILSGCTFGGIGIKRSSNNILCTDNLVTESGNGITVEDFGAGTGGNPNHLLISNNIMSNIGYPKRGTSVAEVGIALTKCSGAVVSNNKIRNCSGVGVSIGSCSNVVVQDNVLSGYPTSPNPSGSSGIFTYNGASALPEKIIIAGNSVSDFPDNGILLQDLTNGIVMNNIAVSAGAGLRIDPTCDITTISYNRFTGTVTDVAFYAGAASIIYENNYLANAATEWEKVGNIRSTAFVTPVGNITPRFPGQLCWITAAGPKIFMSYGLADTEWVQIG